MRCGRGWAGTDGAIDSGQGEVGEGAKASVLEQWAGLGSYRGW